MLGIRDWCGWTAARQWQNIESIVFKLDELLGDVFDPMPRGRPVLDGVRSDNEHAVGLDAGRRKHSTTTEPRCPLIPREMVSATAGSCSEASVGMSILPENPAFCRAAARSNTR